MSVEQGLGTPDHAHEVQHQGAAGGFPVAEDAVRCGHLLLAETASLRDTPFAQIVRSIKRGIE